MINENRIDYQMSLHILMMLMRENLINELEFTAIDNENRKSLIVAGGLLNDPFIKRIDLLTGCFRANMHY